MNLHKKIDGTKSIIEILNKDLYQSLEKDFQTEKLIKSDWLEHFISVFASIDLLGPNGLKQRSGVAEFRYDAI